MSDPKSEGTYVLDEMREADLPRVRAVLTEAFSRILKHAFGRLPPGRTSGERISERFYNPACKGLVIRDGRADVRGAVFVQGYGTRAVGGPIGIDPTFRSSEAAFALLSASRDLCVSMGCEVTDSATFTHLPSHFLMHWRRQSDPLFPALYMMKVLGAPPAARVQPDLTVSAWSSLSPTEKERALEGSREITGRFHRGFDVTAEFRHVQGRGLGESWLVEHKGHPVGFAVCHFGKGSEAFMDSELMIKMLFMAPGHPAATEAFHVLLDEVERQATARGMAMVTGMASGGRRATVAALLDRGFEPQAIFQEWPSVHAAPPLRCGRDAIDFIQPEQLAIMELR